jgi:hypothetical protein
MNLYKKLKQIADYTGKYTYDELVKKLEHEASKGKYSIEIDEIDVLESDIQRLREENIQADYIEGKDYNYYWISWGE